MNLTLLSSFAAGLGLVALAAGLYALQRLRVRHREVDVVTTLFWHEAVHETRARVLVQRFRHPWAYLLVLAICSALWLAVAAPERVRVIEREHVCLLDTSAGMARAGALDAAKTSLLETVEGLPRDARRVIACGGVAHTLLLPGEESLLLEERLTGIAAQAAPSSIERQLESLARSNTTPLLVMLFGGSAPDPALLAILGDDVEVEHIELAEVARADDNRGVTALGVAPATSGAWDAVDVFVEVRGRGLAGEPTIGITLDGQALGMEAQRESTAAGIWGFLFRDVSAAGGLFEVRLSGDDALALDDHAAIVLPDRPRLRVGLDAGLDATLGDALEADPAVELVDLASAEIVILRGAASSAGRPALRFVPAADQREAFLVTYDGNTLRTPDDVLAEAVGSLGLSEIDTTGLAQAADQPIALGVRPGVEREVAVWQELTGEGFDFRDTRAFPLFIARSLRWLSASEELVPWAAVGEGMNGRARFQDLNGAALDPVGVAFTPPIAGEYKSASGALVHAALLSPATTVLASAVPGEDRKLEVTGAPIDLVAWLLLLALAALFGEWVLVRTGRMP